MGLPSTSSNTGNQWSRARQEYFLHRMAERRDRNKIIDVQSLQLETQLMKKLGTPTDTDVRMEVQQGTFLTMRTSHG